MFKKNKINTLKNMLIDRDNKISDLSRVLRKIKEDNKELIENFDYIGKITDRSLILGVEKVDNELFFVTLRVGENPMLCLENFSRKNNYPVLYFDETFVDKMGTRKIKILDLFSKISENRGVGTILLSYLEKYASQVNTVSITGELSSVDNEYFKKLEYFYTKNGYTVSFNPARTSGMIKKTF